MIDLDWINKQMDIVFTITGVLFAMIFIYLGSIILEPRTGIEIYLIGLLIGALSTGVFVGLLLLNKQEAER